ncbi:MAG: hypothetical protein JSR97_09085 [Verrucomicrobia bacterium]|nr:hypothetical protein [Verrucomicrobiota bacterium]
MKINLQQSSDYLSKFENWLWQLTKYYLQPYATFDNSENSFYLNQNPFAGENIHKGPYKVGKKNIGESHEAEDHSSNENLYRVGHPLAQKVIARCKDENLSVCTLEFDLSKNDKKISILENLKGKQGWLQAKQISISSFEMEDHILFAAMDDEGIILQHDQCQRLFSLSANISDADTNISEEIQNSLNSIYHAQQVIISEENAKRNHAFFDDEVDKLEKWSEDVRNSIKFEIKELDKEIKTRKTEARKMLNLEQKVKEQRIIKDLEKKLAEKRYNQYQNEDNIEIKKDNLLDEVEKRLKQKTTENTLFTIRWKVI